MFLIRSLFYFVFFEVVGWLWFPSITSEDFEFSRCLSLICDSFCVLLLLSKDCSHVSQTKEEFYSVRCTVADMKDLYVSRSFTSVVSQTTIETL